MVHWCKFHCCKDGCLHPETINAYLLPKLTLMNVIFPVNLLTFRCRIFREQDIIGKNYYTCKWSFRCVRSDHIQEECLKSLKLRWYEISADQVSSLKTMFWQNISSVCERSVSVYSNKLSPLCFDNITCLVLNKSRNFYTENFTLR